MKKIIFIFFVSVVLFSCEKYPDPGRQTLEQFNYNIIGNNQSAEEGEYLLFEVGVQINLNNLIPNPDKKFHMELEVIKGGGTIENSIIENDNEGKIDNHILFADENGIMKTKWKLGFASNDQIISAKIFDSTNQLYSEFEIKATAMLMNDWNTLNNGYLTKIQEIIVDSVNNRSLMLAGGDLFTREEKFYQWSEIQNYSGIHLKDIEIDSNGDLYGGNWDGTLYKSNNWGKIWDYVCKPIPDNNYHFELTVTKDDYIWANKWEYGIYCSKDGGLTWHNDTVGLVIKEQLGRVYRMKDSHLAISQNQLKILQSFDDGITWQAINTPESSIDMFVTEKNEIIAYNQEAGFSLHKSTDFGFTFKHILSGSVSYGTWPMSHTFEQFGNKYFILPPGGGVYKTEHFEEFEKIISFDLQRNLFIDHTGTIYAGGFNNEPVYILPYNE